MQAREDFRADTDHDSVQGHEGVASDNLVLAGGWCGLRGDRCKLQKHGRVVSQPGRLIRALGRALLKVKRFVPKADRVVMAVMEAAEHTIERELVIRCTVRVAELMIVDDRHFLPLGAERELAKLIGGNAGK